MTIHFEPSTLAVCLREETILSLLNLRQAEGETLESVISRLAELAPHQPTYERVMSDNHVGRQRQPSWPVAPGEGRA